MKNVVVLNAALGLCLLSANSLLNAQTSIITAQFDNSRTAANLAESALNTTNVGPSTFGKVGTFPVDGDVYAQPLYVHGEQINGATRNVLYVATMHNSLYAFDADNPGAGPLFHVSLGTSVPAQLAGTCPSYGTGNELGILSTPALDLGSGTLYAVAATPDGSGGYVHYLHAVDMTTGLEKSGSPILISARVAGNGIDQNNGQVSLNDQTYIQRPGLVLANGNVYAALGSCGPDPEPYHGWLIGYNATTLQQTSVFNSSRNGYEGAIWQSGRAPILDGSGAFYFFTGNGSYNGSSDFSDSLVKLSGQGGVLDWFTPSDTGTIENYDLDLSSSGPILMPDSNRLVGGGKEGIVYVVDPNAMGRQGTPLQQFQATQACGTYTSNGCYQIHSIAYWGSATPTLYVWAAGDNLRAYRSTGGTFDTVPSSQGSLTVSYPGGNLAVSSQGSVSGSGILWATTPSGTLHAYNARDASQELWNSDQNSGRDGLGQFSKFGQMIIADGKVFVPTFSNAVVAYGLLGGPPAAPSNLNFGVDFSNPYAVSLTWSDNSNNETGFAIERSTDGVNFAEISRVAANVTSYSDTTAQSLTYYYYRVRSFNAFGYSAYSGMAGYFVY